MRQSGVELSVIAPMYNEEDNVESTICSIHDTLKDFSLPWELILVNDGSTDNTLAVANAWEDRIDNLRVVSYPINLGRGKALRTGFAHARGSYIVTIDLDLSYSPDHILKLYEELKGNSMIDIVLGSAYMRGGRAIGVPRLRLFLSKWGNKVLQMAFKSRFHTTTYVLRGYRREVLDALVLESNGKEIHLEILSKAVALGFNVKESPATLRSRKRESSKTVLGKTSVSHLLFSLYERPVLLFSAIGILLIVLGLIFGSYIAYLRFAGNLNPGRPLFYLVILLIVTGTQLLFFSVIARQNTFMRNEIYKLQSRLKIMERKIETHQTVTREQGTEVAER